ncbi:hypothetical protein LTR08_006144 [Meristemomyces frigidus]|nr:hypothetical protein LTR08_006144 [Meristemomyces frigidus]
MAIRHAPIDEDEDVIPNFDLIDLTDDDDADGPEYLRNITPDFAENASKDSTPGHIRLEAVECLGNVLSPGLCVELEDGDFLLIKSIVKNSTTRAISLEGILLRRTRRVDDMLAKKYNEVCMILQAEDSQGPHPRLDDCLVSRPIATVTVVRELVRTNRPYPALSFRESGKDYTYYDPVTQAYTTDEELVEETAVLVCRWKYVEFCNRNSSTVVEQMLTRLREEDSDPGKGMPDVWLAQSWRKHASSSVADSGVDNFVDLTQGEMTASGKRRAQFGVVDLTDDREEEVLETSSVRKSRRFSRDGSKSTLSSQGGRTRGGQRISGTAGADQAVPGQYTYGDICAGAGGVASGAQQSGLKLTFLLDHWDDACDTLRANFAAPGTEILNTTIFDFCTSALYRRYHGVDILHISFPCQPHSPAHTVNGKNDAQNIASGYSAIPILKKCRPRIVTLEQTSGMVTHRGGGHFRALIHQLTALGYSARWKIVNMAEHGNVQARKRLIIIAAGPGEALPRTPPPTPTRTLIRDVLARLPRTVDAHMQQHTPRPHGMPYNAAQPLRRAITTSGGDSNTHPCGTRSFNLRELALLQDFPAKHKFVGRMGSVRRQIGNAVPAGFAREMFAGIVGSLRESDGRGAVWGGEVVELE